MDANDEHEPEVIEVPSRVCHSCYHEIRGAFARIGPTPDSVAAWKHFVQQLQRVNPSDCEHCLGEQKVEEPENLTSFDTDNTTGPIPVCKRCFGHAKNYWVRRLSDDSVVPSWPYIKDRLVKVNDATECTSPWCANKPEVVAPQSKEHKQDDPMICDCTNAGCENAAKHRQVLVHIKEITKLFRELTVAYGVTKQLKVQVDTKRDVDLSVPRDGRRGDLKELSHLLMELKLGDDTIETPSGRPLCAVWDPSDVSCHHDLIFKYAPTNCDCTPSICECFNCIRIHVEHCVEDYKEVLSRVRLGITKLRSMPRDGGGPVYNTSSESPATGDCAMPGVRKAKHMKNYAAAQKDAYNRKK